MLSPKVFPGVKIVKNSLAAGAAPRIPLVELILRPR